MATGSDLITNAQRRYGDSTTFHFGTTSHWLPWLNEGQRLLSREAGFTTTFYLTTVSSQAVYDIVTTTTYTPYKVQAVYYDGEW